MKKLSYIAMNFVVCSSLLTQPVLAASSDLGGILLKNTTYAGSWEDPSSGMKYYTGGGIRIKFKGANTSYTPWIKGSAPNYSIGCNGISLNGGFVSLLGLSDIEDQLKDAGAAFAWGILTGLAYSLPAISDVFAKIQSWARTIQRLLQNACSIGQNLAKGSEAAKDFDNTLQDISAKVGFDEVKKFNENMESKNKAVDAMIDCNGDADCMNKKGGAIGKWFTSTFNLTVDNGVKAGNGPTTASMSVKQAIATNGAYYKEIALHELLTVNNSYVSLTEEDILNIKLTLLFFGDIALSNESRAEIAKHFNPDGSVNDDAMKRTGKSLLTTAKKLSDKKYELVPPLYADTTRASELLINGSADDIYVPDYKVGILIVPSLIDPNSKTTMSFLIKEVDSANSAHTNLKLKWDGFYKEGLNQIFTLLNRTSSGKSDVLFSIPVEDIGGNLSSDYVPVLIPEFKDYVEKLRRSVQTDGKKKFSASKIAIKMAQVNAAVATSGLVDEISNRVKKASYGSTDQREIFITFLEQLKTVKENLVRQVEGTYTKDKDVSQMLDDEIRSIINKTKEEVFK